MARQFRVGSPMLREGLKKLETVGAVEIRHGSGVYVGRTPDSLLITNGRFEVAPIKKLLVEAGQRFDDDALLNQANQSFRRQIALASGNVVMHQILDVLSSLFRHEQRMILGIYGLRQHDHSDHLKIHAALRSRDANLASARIRERMELVRAKLLAWDPVANPMSS